MKSKPPKLAARCGVTGEPVEPELDVEISISDEGIRLALTDALSDER